MGDKLDRELFYLDGVWQNIRHNENVRNRLFQIYLIISGSFLVVFQNTTIINVTPEAVLVCSFFVWLIGFFFLWAYERIKEMINRDNKIASHINKNLKEGSVIEESIYSEFINYKERVKTTSFSWYSISSCIALSTSLISALIISVGIRQHLNLRWVYVLLVMFVVVMLNFFLIKAINRFAKITPSNEDN